MEILLYGITKDIVGQKALKLTDEPGIQTVADLKEWLLENYPAMNELRSLAIAVDGRLAESEEKIGPTTELALIPPVSGG